jgi:hypothetical protein
MTSKWEQIIDPVKIKSMYAIYSTYDNDILFSRKEIKKPILCGGIITDFSQNVFNIKNDELVGLISYEQKQDLILSSNLIIKLPNNKNLKLIALLPYASFAMKVLRMVKPSHNQNIVIIEKDPFKTLLTKILNRSGARVSSLKSSDNFEILKNKPIDTLIYSQENSEVKKLVSQFELKSKYELKQISLADVGFEDNNYQKGVKYPYSYIRWDFKKNLQYFVSLVNEYNDFLNFFDIEIIKISDFEEISHKIDQLKTNMLYLFQKT